MNKKNGRPSLKQAAKSGGFTLIELVMVIVILGILAAVALPKFTDLSNQASKASTQGIAGAITSGSAMNFAARKAGAPSAVQIKSATACNDPTSLQVLQGGGIPQGYTMMDDGSPQDCSGTADVVNCVVTNTQTGQQANATVYCAR